MIMKRIVAIVLSVIMLLGTVMVEAGAYAVDLIYQIDPKTKKATENVDYESTVKQYLSLEFATAEEKLESMEMMLEKDGYQLWVDPLTGEVATKDLASGQILFSNPYDVGAKFTSKTGAPSDSTKKKLMSQIMIRYTDNDTEKDMYSFDEAAMRGQIKVKNIKNGVRVEYSIGREETRMLVPKIIEKNRFETVILDVFANEINEISREHKDDDEPMFEINWRDYNATSGTNSRGDRMKISKNGLWFGFNQLQAYYNFKSTDECTSEREEKSLLAAFPICRKMDVYVFSTDATPSEIVRVENYIKTYVSSYNYEQLEYDHNLTEYEGSDKSPALFKLSLEYMLDEWGMSVRLPVNGLRFNESLYQLTYVSVLPYMGAGANHLLGDQKETFTGYNFFPDGSGTLFRHEDLNVGNTTTINAKVYGFDFAYNNITGTHSETIRYPVFGIVSNYHDIRKTTEEVLVSEEVKDPTTGEVISPAEYEEVEKDYIYKEDRGFAAIIEEGDALAELSTYHAGALSKYNSISMLFYPRPKDSYNLANAISVGANASWTVVSSRKYTGNYKIRYIMLTDADIAKEKGIEDYYEVSWMGMAQAYRDYLYDTGVLKALSDDDVDENIPAFIETFGALETTEKILSIPVNVMSPLSTFDNIKTMYEELSAEGVGNIKFKLTGFANGGMFSSIPYRLKWEKAVGGAKGYSDLVEYADEKGFQIFPDFDFAYVRASTDKLFDGLQFKKHIVKSINDTYMSKRYYSATRQTMMGRYELAVSAAYYEHFYEKLSENLLKYYEGDVTKTISVASLGSALNSDFDEDEPYNREDSKKLTIKAFENISSKFDDVMTESGNAYTWKYVDYITSLPLDSSRYTKSGASVPFIGVVLHGSKQFSGSPLNMEGNIGYSLLKAIENGAGVYFTLCYQNYSKLKENQVLNSYYSVRYDILKDDIVKYYTLVNDLTKDLQTSLITSHEFLIGERIPDPDEIEADAAAAAKAIADEIAAAEEAESKAKLLSLLNGRVYAEQNSASALEQVRYYYEQAIANDTGAYSVDTNGKVTLTIGMNTLVSQVLELTDQKNALQADADTKLYNSDVLKAVLDSWKEIYNPFNSFMSTGLNGAYTDMISTYEKGLASHATNQATADTRMANVEKALSTYITAQLAKVESLLKTYKETPNEENLAAVVAAAGSLENAEQYVYLYGKKSETAADLKAMAGAYLTSEAYLALKAKADEAAAAETAALAEEAELINSLAGNAEYTAAKQALSKAQTALTQRKTVLSNIITNCDNLLPTVEEKYNEHKLLADLRADAEAELAVVALGTDTSNEYIAAVAAARAELAKFTPKSSAAGAASDAAKAELKAYEDNYRATYESSAEYAAAEAAADSAAAAVDAIIEKITAESPAKAALDEYVKYAEERAAASRERSSYELAYLTDAKYNELKDASDKANAEFKTVSSGLLAGMEDSSEYKKLKEEYDNARAALDVFELAYEQEEKFQPVKEAYEKAKEAYDKFVEIPDTEEYRKLKSDAEKASEEYEKVIASVADIINGKSDAAITDAQIKQIDSAAAAKGKAVAELEMFEAKHQAEVEAIREYPYYLSDLNVSKRAVESYAAAYLKTLEQAIKDSESEEKPEETLGGKYKAAKAAFQKAETALNYFTGATSVPKTVTDAKVWSEMIKTDAKYVAADQARSKAKDNLSNYQKQFSAWIMATTEAGLSGVTDPAILELNAKYIAASAKYNAANDQMTAAGNALRTVDPQLYSAANSYYSVVNTLISNENTDLANKTNLETSGLKAAYDKANASFSKVKEKVDSLTKESSDAEADYTLTATELGTVTKKQADAIKSVKTQISRVSTNIVPRLNYYVKNARTALADTDYALEVLGSDTSYSEDLRKDLAATNAKVHEIEAEIRELSKKTLEAAKHSLEEASKIITTDTTVADPYDDSTPAEETEEEETEEDEGYPVTKYTDQSGNIVRIGYANGVSFVLNYNYFDVTCVVGEETVSVPAYGGIRFNADGTSKTFTTKIN